MDDERYILLGRYIDSLSDMSAAMSGPKISAVVPFLRSGVEISKKGKAQFQKSNPDYVYGRKLMLLNDFLYFAGVKTGQTRKHRDKALEKKSVLNQRNQEQISAFVAWLNNRKDYSERTLYIHREGMKIFFLYSDEFNQEQARRFIATLEDNNLSPKTINIRINTLSLYGEFTKKPIDIKKRKTTRTLCVENVPTEDEYQRILDYTKSHNPKWMYWVIRLLGSTGMRLSEILMIQWKHVIQGEAFLKCKGSKYRSIYFPDSVRAEAKEYIESNGIDTEQFVARNRWSLVASSRAIGWHLRHIAEKSGYPKEKAHCHAFRHFFAKMYLRKSGDVIQLAELLGHESVDTTRIYLQKSKAEQVKDVNRNVTW
jgi:integrase